MNARTKIFQKAYELLERATPLRTDCGKFCAAACCQGDENTGMWLFPGEEERLQDVPGFTIKECEANFGYKMLICSGGCDRKTRPLACRFYPYFPMLTDGGYGVRADIRGIASCPLLQKNTKVEYAFIRQIRKAAKVLARDDELKSYLLAINTFLDDMEAFAERMAD